ncbi:MAG: hypothetical protein ACXWQO_17285 [Bdellovibrionota bacterium]
MKFFALLLFFPALAFAQNEQILNTAADVRVLLENSHGKAFPEQLVEWNIFEHKYQDIYDAAVFTHDRDDWQERRLQSIQKFFSSLPQIEKPMMELFASANEIAATQASRFQKVFPDLKPGTPIVFLPGMRFNGRASSLPRFNRDALLIGLDMVVSRQDSIDVLFSHEFFHIYHFDHLGGDDGENSNTMSSPLWFEGFATYVSQVLNPSASEAEVLMDKPLSEGCAKTAAVAAWAKDYLTFYAKNDWKEHEADPFYYDWFRIGGPTLPNRRGYCLGYLAVKAAAESHSIQELVDWKPENFIPFIGAEFKRLSQ